MDLFVYKIPIMQHEYRESLYKIGCMFYDSKYLKPSIGSNDTDDPYTRDAVCKVLKSTRNNDNETVKRYYRQSNKLIVRFYGVKNDSEFEFDIETIENRITFVNDL